MATPNPTLPQLIARLMNMADNLDAFGPTRDGSDIRLAASILANYEVRIVPALEEARVELARIESVIARSQV